MFAVDPADPPALLQTTSVVAEVVFSGVFAGFLATILVFEASLRGFGAAVYTQVRLIELEHLDSLTFARLAAVAVPVQSSRNAVQPSAAIGNNKSKRTTP
ncbi:MAG: hypothetical protein JWR32_6338 [Mycobacterium sp.]|jgi:hypothetical protein|nr:hypothetical protein [Mycobacterium sp.]